MKYFLFGIIVISSTLISGCIKFETDRYDCLISPVLINIEDKEVRRQRRIEDEELRARRAKESKKVVIVNNR